MSAPGVTIRAMPGDLEPLPARLASRARARCGPGGAGGRAACPGPGGAGADIAVTPLDNVARLVGELALPELHGDGRRLAAQLAGTARRGQRRWYTNAY